MKLKITQKGVFDAENEEMEVGKTITVKGSAIPGHLVGKAEPLEVGAQKKQMIVNPATLEAELADVVKVAEAEALELAELRREKAERNAELKSKPKEAKSTPAEPKKG